MRLPGQCWFWVTFIHVRHRMRSVPCPQSTARTVTHMYGSVSRLPLIYVLFIVTPPIYRAWGQWDVMAVENESVSLQPELEDKTRDILVKFSYRNKMCPDIKVSEKMGAWLQPWVEMIPVGDVCSGRWCIGDEVIRHSFERIKQVSFWDPGVQGLGPPDTVLSSKGESVVFGKLGESKAK